MFSHIEWTVFAQAETGKKARRLVTELGRTIGAPLEIISSERCADRDRTYRFAFRTALGVEDGWQASFHALDAARRLATEWHFCGPDRYDDDTWRYEGVAAEAGIRRDGVVFIQFFLSNEQEEWDDADADQAADDDDDDLGSIEMDGEWAVLMEKHRLAGRRHVRAIVLESRGLSAARGPLAARLPELAAGHALCLQDPSVQVSAAIAGLERLVLALMTDTDEEVQPLQSLVLHSRWQELPFCGEDVQLLLAIGSVLIEPEVQDGCFALHLPLQAAATHLRRDPADTDLREVACDLLELLEQHVPLYHQNAELLRHLKWTLNETGSGSGAGPRFFSAVDPWGRRMQQVDFGPASEFVAHLLRGTGRSRPRQRWTRRCVELVTRIPRAETAVRTLLEGVLAVAREEEELVLAFSWQGAGENERLVKGALWTIPHLDAPWAPELLTELCLLFEEHSEPLTRAAATALESCVPARAAAGFRRVQSEAKGRHLRLLAERLLGDGQIRRNTV